MQSFTVVLLFAAFAALAACGGAEKAALNTNAPTHAAIAGWDQATPVKWQMPPASNETPTIELRVLPADYPALGGGSLPVVLRSSGELAESGIKLAQDVDFSRHVVLVTAVLVDAPPMMPPGGPAAIAVTPMPARGTVALLVSTSTDALVYLDSINQQCGGAERRIEDMRGTEQHAFLVPRPSETLRVAMAPGCDPRLP